MSSSYAHCATLDASWIDDSRDFDNSTNADTSRNSEPDFDNDMPLPPEDFYTTQEELFNSIQAWAKQHKYTFRIGQWKPVGKHQKKYTYVCTRYRPKPIMDCPQHDLWRLRDRIRSTRTKKTSCEFSVCGVQVDDHH
jgi:hypothetical protein